VMSRTRLMGAGMELSARRKDGTEFPVEISLSPLAGESGTLVIAAVRDITERKRTEARVQALQEEANATLRTSEAMFRGVLDGAPDGMIIVDRAGLIVLVNRQALTLFSASTEELVGRPVEILLPEAYRATHHQHREAFHEAPRARSMGAGMELLARRLDGAEFPVEISLSPLESDRGILVIAAVRDITERKRTEASLQALREEAERRRVEAERAALEQAARRAEKLASLGTLAAGLAHELNNPIGIMSSRIELILLEDAALSAELRDDLQVLQRQAQRVAKITNGLLSFARQSSGDRGPVDLNHVVQETLALAERQIEKEGVRFAIELAPDLPAIFGDADTLQQVVLNLLTNARDALAAGGGDIHIRTARREGRPDFVELVVADTGPGIAPEDLTRLFDPFFTTKPAGTGLGLSISHGIVREHGGTIDVESSPGRGTRFVLAFPAIRPGEHG
jgi:PAS domain S-box-containing protein